MICGRKARTTVTTSRRIESFTQCVYVSSAVLEKPKSYARVKNCRPPSSRRAASSSSVRIIPSSGPSSLPIRFCPPSPRVSERYAVSTFCPAREPGEELGVLVVGVGTDQQHATRHVEPRHRFTQRDCAALLG